MQATKNGGQEFSFIQDTFVLHCHNKVGPKTLMFPGNVTIKNRVGSRNFNKFSLHY